MTKPKKTNPPISSTCSLSKAPPPISPLRGSSYVRPKPKDERLPRWSKWRLMPTVELWEAVALWLNIEPDKIKTDGNAWMGDSPPFDEGEEFSDRLSVLQANSNRTNFPTPCKLNMGEWYRSGVRLDEFASWAISVAEWPIPDELKAIAANIAPTMPVSAPVADIVKADTPDETLAAMFDAVTVEALEKMFPANGKWKSWAEKAARYGLKGAREGRALFNPYKAGVWFLTEGITGWDIARLNRTLANNLPARSRDDAHLLTRSID